SPLKQEVLRLFCNPPEKIPSPSVFLTEVELSSPLVTSSVAELSPPSVFPSETESLLSLLELRMGRVGSGNWSNLTRNFGLGQVGYPNFGSNFRALIIITFKCFTT